MRNRANGGRRKVTALLVAACAILTTASCTSGKSPAIAPVSSIAVFASTPGQPAPTQNPAEISASQAGNLTEYLPCSVGKVTQSIRAFGTTSYTVDVTARLATHATANSTTGTAPTAGEYEVATIQIRVRKGSYAYAAAQFRFLNPKGQLFEPAANGAAAGYGPPLGTGILRAGQVVNGTVIFDVPAGGGGLILKLAGEFGGFCRWVIGT
jgi:hypothetical protein